MQFAQSPPISNQDSNDSAELLKPVVEVPEQMTAEQIASDKPKKMKHRITDFFNKGALGSAKPRSRRMSMQLENLED